MKKTSYRAKVNLSFTSDGFLIVPPLAFDSEDDAGTRELEHRVCDIYTIFNKKLGEFILSAEPSEAEAEKLIELFRKLISEKAPKGNFSSIEDQ